MNKWQRILVGRGYWEQAGDDGAAGGGPSAQDVMDFDPFDPEFDTDSVSGGEESGSGDNDVAASDDGGTPPAEDYAGAEDAGQSESGGAEAAAPAEEDTSGETPQDGGKDSEAEFRQQMLELQQQNAALLQRLAEKEQAGDAQAQAQAQGEARGVEVPNFQFNVPDQLQQMLDSEDPTERRQGYAHLATGIARETYRKAAETMQTQFQQFSQALPQWVGQQQQAVEAQKQVAEDFYGAFPELNKPELRGVNQQIAQEVWQASGAKEWSPELRDKIGTEIRNRLGLAQQPAAPQTPPRKPTPPRQFGGGSRPTAPTKDSEQDEMLDLLG